MSETWTYIGCATVLAAAIPLAIWLKREGERAWALHVSRRVWVRIIADTTAFTAAMASASAAISKFGIAAADMERSMRKVAEVMQTKPRPRPTAHGTTEPLEDE